MLEINLNNFIATEIDQKEPKSLSTHDLYLFKATSINYDYIFPVQKLNFRNF